VYSRGIWHETTLAGLDGKEMCQFIFGDIDVPQLDDDTSTVSPYDSSRSMRLNSNNETVQAIFSFIGMKIEEVRKKLVDQEKQKRATEEMRRLEEQARDIAQLINDDFSDFQKRVMRTVSRGGWGRDRRRLDGKPVDEEGLRLGGNIPVDVVSAEGGAGSKDGNRGNGGPIPNRGPQLIPAKDSGVEMGQAQGGNGNRVSSSGGFRVSFRTNGSEAPRAQYEERVIYINLEHPQVVACLGAGGIDDVTFRRFAYEIAFSEYAIALAHELDKVESLPSEDILYEIRHTIDRMARKSAPRYLA
jgi:hypothetical protein